MAIRQSINTTLRGFLDLFQLRNNGANPQVVAEFMQPVIDLQRWYLESIAKTYTFSRQNFFVANTNAGFIPITSTTPTNLSNGTNVVIPQSEIWLLMPGTRILAGFSANAGQSIELAMVAQNVSSDQFDWVPLDPREGFASSAAAPLLSQARTLSRPFWLQPGWTLTGYHHGATVPAGDIDIGGTLKLVRLRI